MEYGKMMLALMGVIICSAALGIGIGFGIGRYSVDQSTLIEAQAAAAELQDTIALMQIKLDFAEFELSSADATLAIYEGAVTCQTVTRLFASEGSMFSFGESEICGLNIGVVPGLWGPSLTEHIELLKGEIEELKDGR